MAAEPKYQFVRREVPADMQHLTDEWIEPISTLGVLLCWRRSRKVDVPMNRVRGLGRTKNGDWWVNSLDGPDKGGVYAREQFDRHCEIVPMPAEATAREDDGQQTNAPVDVLVTPGNVEALAANFKYGGKPLCPTSGVSTFMRAGATIIFRFDHIPDDVR